MGFDFNPFKHIEVIHYEKDRPPYNDKEYPAGFYLYCHNCGGQTWVPPRANLEDLFAVQRKHVEESHGRTDSDFEGWSPE